eukprot:NODE_3894_length_1965_cov_7.285637.p1 GENE.NODE_3894_length_1965_cov_7.285637~~NODE_3894_length_1965_cov_7.285637.p1  ORF type:complete len:338 (+),score=68.64 NODE_3894_length_1965_cov_7.285637:551-1564(+)
MKKPNRPTQAGHVPPILGYQDKLEETILPKVVMKHLEDPFHISEERHNKSTVTFDAEDALNREQRRPSVFSMRSRYSALKERQADQDNAESANDGSFEDFGDVANEPREAMMSFWPPAGPKVNFRSCVARTTIKAPYLTASARLEDPIVRWINMFFAMDLQTEQHLDAGFGIIVLIILDAVLPGRVPWTRVSFPLLYRRAQLANFSLVEELWVKAGVEKAPELRDYAGVNLEALFAARAAEKLEFFRHLRRWFDGKMIDARRRGVEAFDAMRNRKRFVDTCIAWGHQVVLPRWILYDYDIPKSTSRSVREPVPEYQRLKGFLTAGKPQLRPTLRKAW